MIVNIDSPKIKMQVLVLHAYDIYGYSKDEVAQWWKTTDELVKKHRKEGLGRCFMIDANTEVPGRESDNIGDQASGKSEWASDLFEEFLVAQSLALPTTHQQNKKNR